MRKSIYQRFARGSSRVLEVPLHPILLSLYPVLALLAANLGQVDLQDSLRPIALSLAFSVFVFSTHALITREATSAAVLTSMTVLLFFSYGHIYSEIKSASYLGIVLGRHRYLAASYLIVYSITLAGMRSVKVPRKTTLTLNVVSFILVCMPLIKIAADEPWIDLDASDLSSKAERNVETDIQGNLELPDIYYIVPDSYLRADVLREQYSFANQEFLDFLSRHDFYVAKDSTSNYMWTHQSLSSSLNMNYIHELIPGDEPGRRIDPNTHIHQSLVRRELERLGYQTVGFVTGWRGSELLDADLVLYPGMTRMERMRSTGTLNDFEAMFLYVTPVRILLDLDKAGRIPITRYIRGRLQQKFDIHREIILSLFDNLKSVPEIPGPKFVFAHILSPHSPYVFNRNGEPIDQEGPFTLSQSEELLTEREMNLYLDQLIFINRQLMETVEEILENSQRPVVIVIQADHGFGVDLHWEDVEWQELHARMSILNAYHLSEKCEDELYSSITPVNTFRLIFECEIGMEYALLEDTVYIGYDRFAPLEEYLEIRNIPSD